MEQILSVTELVRHVADYVNRVFYQRERFVLVRDKKPVAELRPLPVSRTLGELPSILAALPSLSAEEADGLRDDLEAARAERAGQPLRDPWPS